MTSTAFPPLSSVLKSRDVEDFVNLYFNRPLGYLVARGLAPTGITPNGVTFLAILLGCAAGGAWLWGTPTAMLLGGILLWSSAIFDGADGILARATGQASPYGRAVDGAADLIVAVVTVLPAVTHLWWQHHNLWHFALAVPAIMCTLLQLRLYDYFKEQYLFMTRPERRSELESVEAVKARADRLEAEGASLAVRLAMKPLYVAYVGSMFELARRAVPRSQEFDLDMERSEQTAAIYRAHNRNAMRPWIAISLAPHSYLLAIAGMMDRIDLYLWFRVVGANLFFVVAVLWQRAATARTLDELAELRASEAACSAPLRNASA